jgi:hypothetical protein
VHRYETSGGHRFVLVLIHADLPGDHALAHGRLLAAVDLVHRQTGREGSRGSPANSVTPRAASLVSPTTKTAAHQNRALSLTPKVLGSERFSPTTTRPGPADASFPAVKTARFSRFFT